MTLPLWAQAAALSAGLALLMVVVPLIGRWIWRWLIEGRRS